MKLQFDGVAALIVVPFHAPTISLSVDFWLLHALLHFDQFTHNENASSQEITSLRRFRFGIGAGGEIRTLNPSRGLVFETSAYTVPPHRLVSCMILYHMQEVNM